METEKTKLSAVAEELSELDKRFKDPGSDLNAVEREYAGKLVHAIGNENKVLECEALKSLGDLYLHKAKMKKDKKENFNKACALYTELSRYYTSEEEKQVIQRRVRYAEKCTKLVHDEIYANTKTEDSANITLAVAATLQEEEEKVKAKEQGIATLIEGYTRAYVKAIVERNKRLQVESLKSLGDLYLETGKIGKDETVFTKAAGLYRAALDRCEDSDGRETLEHRIKYAEKIRAEVEMKRKKTRQPGSGGTRKTVATSHGRTHGTKEDPYSAYTDQLQEGCKALQTGDLDTAERHFAAALRTVHLKDSNTDQHRKEAEPLYKLSDVYLKRGIQSKDGGDFTKAAALCNAALVRARKEDGKGIKQRVLDITNAFIKHVLNVDESVDNAEVEKHRLRQKESREFVEEELKRIEEEVDPYSLDDDDPKIREVETNRAEAIKKLFETLVGHRRTFIVGLVDECIEVMAPPPCNYAMIGLGSQATGLVTPYSDLEFAILIEEETESNVEYFRNLTHYLHLKVINLGETILPAMAIKSLNDFQSKDPQDSWFYDSVTPHGFSFDGAMPHACKTPLGRGKTFELIRTPRNMTKLLEENITLHLKKGYHLASVLGNVSLIAGEWQLAAQYTTMWAKRLQENQGIISSLIANTILTENAPTFKRHVLKASLLNVKKEIYRFSSITVSCWALLHGIQPTTIWDTIENMHKNGVINSENAHHLMVLVSISAELRLRTYMNNRGQVENMSALSSMSSGTEIGEKLRNVFYFSNSNQLMRYYYTAMPLRSFISEINAGESPMEPSILFDNSSKLKSEVYASLCDYQNAKTYTEQALQNCLSKYGENATHPDIAEALESSGIAFAQIGDHRKAVAYFEQALEMRRNIHGKETAHADIAMALIDLGTAWSDIGDPRKATIYYEQSLEMMLDVYGKDGANPYFAACFNYLGTACRDLGDHRQAVTYYEHSLKMWRAIVGEGNALPDIAINVLNNLGESWTNLGDHRKALSYNEQSLQMMRGIYGENTAHPDIAMSLNNLGCVFNQLGDYRKAANYHERSLQMRRTIYGENTPHPKVAHSLNNLGGTFHNLGDHVMAADYYKQSLQMWQSMYGEDTAHPDIAAALNHIGGIWANLGDHRKAASYHEQALEMMIRISGKDTAHPDIAASLNGLGNAWNNLGDQRKAICYHEMALQMKSTIIGEGTFHPDIVASLNNLGNAWRDCGDHKKAINYFERSLQMTRSMFGDENADRDDIATLLNNLGISLSNVGDHRKALAYYDDALQAWRSVFGKNADHHHIAKVLNNLGNACMALGDHKMAVSYHEQSLQMKRRIYGENTAHPAIVTSLGNLRNAWKSLGDHRKAHSYYAQELQMMFTLYHS
ncbi:PREDICTED: uncharacterized protein LOC109485154 [Branchiostoma belcheri]|uniref:Uncharacterized protein LOC109485154 n=1 Tax=Branchiostoma belcheri TaxID=7741 RepID=A0A6P4ZSJ3_BRABE|nr:PREDICTED: uncharacterized protein LOC109485154 [Branchiostoma belcheri]